MTKVIANSEVRARFLNFDRALEVCDESGHTLGFFRPLNEGASGGGSPISREELDRRRQNLSGRPLSEILKGLSAS